MMPESFAFVVAVLLAAISAYCVLSFAGWVWNLL